MASIEAIYRELTFEEDTSDPGLIPDLIDALADQTPRPVKCQIPGFRTVSVRQVRGL